MEKVISQPGKRPKKKYKSCWEKAHKNKKTVGNLEVLHKKSGEK